MDILQNPLSGVTERYKRLHFNARQGNHCRKLFVAEGLIQSRAIATHTGWTTLFELKSKGRMLLRDIGYEVKDELTEGVEHKFWKEEIARHYRSRAIRLKLRKRETARLTLLSPALGEQLPSRLKAGSLTFSEILSGI